MPRLRGSAVSLAKFAISVAGWAFSSAVMFLMVVPLGGSPWLPIGYSAGIAVERISEWLVTNVWKA